MVQFFFVLGVDNNGTAIKKKGVKVRQFSFSWPIGRVFAHTSHASFVFLIIWSRFRFDVRRNRLEERQRATEIATCASLIQVKPSEEECNFRLKKSERRKCRKMRDFGDNKQTTKRKDTHFVWGGGGKKKL